MSTTTPTPPAPPAPPAVPQPSSPGRPSGGARLGLQVGAVVTGLLIIAGALSLFQLTAGHDTTRTNRSFPLVAPAGGALPSLAIRADAADVDVVGSDGDQVTVEQVAQVPHGESMGAPTLTSSTLNLPSHCHGSSLDWLLRCHVSYVVHVPGLTSLQVRTGSGDVTAEGVTADTAALHLGSGDLDVVNGAISTLSGGTGSGDIDVNGSTSGRTTLETGSGDLSLQFAQDPIQVTATTGSGDLDVVVPDDQEAYVVHGQTGSGDYSNHVDTSDTSARTITAKTGSGDLTIRYAR